MQDVVGATPARRYPEAVMDGGWMSVSSAPLPGERSSAPSVRESTALVRVCILGPVGVETASGWQGNLSPQLRKVAAVLALTGRAPLSVLQIVDRIWGMAPPESAAQMVRNHIRSLRRLPGALGAPGAPRPRRDGGIVERTDVGYRFTAGAVEIDAEVFRSLVDRGLSLHLAGAHGEVVRTLGSALQLWRGREALVGVGDVLDLRIEAAQLDELRFRAETVIAEAHLMLAHPDDALPLAQAMTMRHPFRERPWLHLMVAQALTGRRIEASGETYRRARHHLVEETGLDAPDLVRVHQALLRDASDGDLVAMLVRR